MSKHSKKHKHSARRDNQPRFELSAITKAQLEAAAKTRRAVEQRTKEQTNALKGAPAKPFMSEAAARIFAQAHMPTIGSTKHSAKQTKKAIKHSKRDRDVAPVSIPAFRSARVRRDEQGVMLPLAHPLMPEAQYLPHVDARNTPFFDRGTYSADDNNALRADLWLLMTATILPPTSTRCEHYADDAHICGQPSIGVGNNGINTCQTHHDATLRALIMARLQRAPKA